MMTREEFNALWAIGGLTCSPANACKYVHADVNYEGRSLWLNFDLYTEEEVYALGTEFFQQLKEKLSELDASRQGGIL